MGEGIRGEKRKEEEFLKNFVPFLNQSDIKDRQEIVKKVVEDLGSGAAELEMGDGEISVVPRRPT
jgi:nitrogen regulatory protein PII